MKQFMYIFRNTQEAEEAYVQQSPAQMESQMAIWMNWMEGLAAKDRLVSGEPLIPEGVVLRKSTKHVTDGPFIEGKDIVGGFVIVKAESLQEAIDLADGCPMFALGGTVEVRQIMAAD
jgi:hypothetical protein